MGRFLSDLFQILDLLHSRKNEKTSLDSLSESVMKLDAVLLRAKMASVSLQ